MYTRLIYLSEDHLQKWNELQLERKCVLSKLKLRNSNSRLRYSFHSSESSGIDLLIKFYYPSDIDPTALRNYFITARRIHSDIPKILVAFQEKSTGHDKNFRICSFFKVSCKSPD